MLDIKYIREHAELIKQNNINRGVEVDLERLFALDSDRRAHISQIEELRAKRNLSSRSKPSDVEIAEMKKTGDLISQLEKELDSIGNDYVTLLKSVPNLTHPDAPIGGENDFKVIDTAGGEPKFKFPAKDHEELMLSLDLIDFERAAKTTAAKFFFAKNDLVVLNNALIRYGIDILRKQGFTVMETPDIVNNQILEGVGFSPRGPESNTYMLADTDLSLIATAEITLGGYHADEIIDLSKGPLKYAGISHCFRKEAGAYGKASKGIYRVHQFTKLEMFVYCKPDESENIHKQLLDIEREIVDGLQIPYRVIDTASRDLGAPAYRKYDIEAWMVMNNGYGEITSTSNCTDYQARRLNIRYRKENGETEYTHTLNGTAVVTSRFPVAIFENFQKEDGSIEIPKALRPYMDGQKKIGK